MAFTITPNVRCANLSDAIRRMKNALVAAGWSVMASSDGTTYGASSDVITGYWTGVNPSPGSISNGNAWLRLRMPGGAGQPEILIKHSSGANTDGWQVRYSPSAGFTGGTPNATTAPTATDSMSIAGNDTGTFQAYYLGSLISVNQNLTGHWIVGDATEQYAFLFITSTSGRSDLSGLFGLDRCTNLQPGDTDPSIIFFGAGQTALLNILSMGVANRWTPGDGNNLGAYGFQKGYDASLEAQMKVHSLGLFPQVIRGTTDCPFDAWNPYTGRQEYYNNCWWVRTMEGSVPPANTQIRRVTPIKGKSRVFKAMTSQRLFGRTLASKTLFGAAEVFVTATGHMTYWSVWDGTTTPKV